MAFVLTAGIGESDVRRALCVAMLCRMDEKRDRRLGDVADLEPRMTSLERRFADVRLGSIEKRLNPVDLN